MPLPEFGDLGINVSSKIIEKQTNVDIDLSSDVHIVFYLFCIVLYMIYNHCIIGASH